MTTAAPAQPQELADLLLDLQFKLPIHTFKAVRLRAEGLETDEARRSYLLDVLAERERSEGCR